MQLFGVSMNVGKSLSLDLVSRFISRFGELRKVQEEDPCILVSGSLQEHLDFWDAELLYWRNRGVDDMYLSMRAVISHASLSNEQREDLLKSLQAARGRRLNFKGRVLYEFTSWFKRVYPDRMVRQHPEYVEEWKSSKL